jgi:nicotinate-nucleotide pyrophosphorylase (carboxylating)
MLPSYLSDETLQSFLASAFKEDVGYGDHSSLASIPQEFTDEAILLMKDHGIIAGIELARRIFSYYDDQLNVETFATDGDSLKPGNHVLKVSGSARSILACERLVLNCMQRMSGIATYTNRLVSMIDHTRARLLDTRKTTPNFRIMEKWAVVIGGGVNHRFGLFDMIMLKDNHIDFAGGISEAISAAVAYVKKNHLSLKIEIETRNLEEVRQVLTHGQVDRIMLDNMSVNDMRTAVELINDVYETEASGGINEDTIGQIAETGVNYISVGALTHSVASLDMSLKAVKHLKL